MATETSRSSAEATLRRAAAFLRIVRADASDAAPSAEDEQLLLPHLHADQRDGARGELEADGEATPIEKTVWGSPAGKKKLAPRLVKLIPPHKTYVEPFAGSGAVFFAKEPVDKEVLSDADPDIAFAYKALSRLTDGELAALKKKDWTGRKSLFQAMKEAKPKTKVEKLYQFLYLSHFAYGKLRGKSFNPNAEGIAAHTIKRIEKFRDRLRNVTVRSGHYADVVKEFDGKDTFFFLDPPYPGYNVAVGEDKFDETEFRKILDGIKGKFLITYGVRGKLDTSGFEVRTIRTPRTISAMRGVGGPKMLSQLLIANYGITQKSLGPFELESLDAAVDLPSPAAADLDLLCVLTKALAIHAEAPSIRGLAAELARLEDVSGDRAAVLAHELLPIGDRLVPAISIALPAIAKSLIDARPAIASVAKTAATASRAGSAPPAGKQAADARPVPLTKRIPILKTGEERYVLGVVLEPETVDAQNDIYSADTVRDAAHKFLADYQHIGLMHKGLIDGRVKILESYLAPTSFELDGAKVKQGTWLLAVRVEDDKLWAQIKNGELTGLSMGGSALSAPEPDSDSHDTA